MARRLLLLEPLQGGQDLALLALRLVAGGFLVWEMWPNVSDPAHMQAVIGYFGDNGFAYPEFFGPLSAWAQLLIGAALILGLLTRWAGIFLTFNFVVGVWMVHWGQTYREQWPALALIVFGLIFATIGAGRWAVDSLWERNPA